VPSELQFTGERFTPECEREIWYEHMHRYVLASQWCKGLRVLDAACGEGYGSALLAGAAAEVVGLDISAEAIGHARARYGGLDRLTFKTGDCGRLPFADGEFQCIVSFETLEHIEDQAGMLAEFRRVLSPDGFMVLSSPDKAVYSEELGNRNEFHVRELYRDELLELLGEHFPHFRLLGQRLLFHSAVWSLGGGDRVALQHLDDSGLPVAAKEPHAPPVYFIALCAGRADCLPDLKQDLWLFDDSGQSVYRHYLGEIRKNMAAGGIIAERDREIEDLKRQVGDALDSLPWYRRLFRRNPGGA